MTSKLICLLMNWETFNKPGRQRESCNKGHSNIFDGTFVKIVSNANLKTLIILVERSILDA